MEVTDADFPSVRKYKAPLLVKACKRLLTDKSFGGEAAALCCTFCDLCAN